MTRDLTALSDAECDALITTVPVNYEPRPPYPSRALIRAGYAAGLAAAQAPPREATVNMLYAANKINAYKHEARDIWRAMHDAWTAQDQSSEVASATREDVGPKRGREPSTSLDPSPASTLSPEDAELLRWLSLYASDWPDHDNGFDATASRLREVLAENALRDEEATDYRAAFQKAEVELAEERRQHNMSCADAHEALDKAEAELAAVRAERDALQRTCDKLYRIVGAALKAAP